VTARPDTIRRHHRMNLFIHPDADSAASAAAGCLTSWLEDPAVINVMVAAGNTPLDLYRRVGERGLNLTRLHIFALDEYVGVPANEPRNCANILRRAVADAWGIPTSQFHAFSQGKLKVEANAYIHELLIEVRGGLHVVVLGLGQNGHLGFNEPGSTEGSKGRLVQLEATSIEANRKWFGGDYAPALGVTHGMRTILNARRVLIMALGAHKAAAVKAMLEGPVGPQCPASFLRNRPRVFVYLDEGAAANLQLTA
jgi:glucosamine-6-phosphate deaminase